MKDPLLMKPLLPQYLTSAGGLAVFFISNTFKQQRAKIS
jgi:hypothetical protein